MKNIDGHDDRLCRELIHDDDYLIETWLDVDEEFWRLAIHHGSPGFEYEDTKTFKNCNFPTREGAVANGRIWIEGTRRRILECSP